MPTIYTARRPSEVQRILDSFLEWARVNYAGDDMRAIIAYIEALEQERDTLAAAHPVAAHLLKVNRELDALFSELAKTIGMPHPELQAANKIVEAIKVYLAERDTLASWLQWIVDEHMETTDWDMVREWREKRRAARIERE